MSENDLLRLLGLSDEEQLLWLSLVKGIGISTLKYICWLYHNNISKAIEAIANHVDYHGRLPDVEYVQQEYRRNIEYGAKFIFANNARFPSYIRNTPYIICKGDLGLLNHRNKIAIVGSRKADLKSDLFTRQFVNAIKDKFVIVSGLAEGIDTIALTGATRGIAVIGCGFGHNYPLSNKKLQQDLEKNGLVITMQLFNEKPCSYSFSNRNQIIVAIANEVAIMEAGNNSGTLNTASHADKMNKKLYVVPGHPTNKNFEGSNYLIQSGLGKVLLSAQDIKKEEDNKLAQHSPMEFSHIDQKCINLINKHIEQNKSIKSLLGEFTEGQINGAIGSLEWNYSKDLSQYYIISK